MATMNAIGSQYPFATADYGAASVTYAKIQNVAASSLLGNPTGSPATVEEITLGTGLTFSGTTLNAKITLPFTTVSGTSQSAAVNNGYFTNNASLVTVTLPAAASVGDVVEVAGQGAGGWLLAQNAAQLIHGTNGAVTTTGTGGSLASTNQWDIITVRCVIANTTWTVDNCQGNLTVV